MTPARQRAIAILEAELVRMQIKEERPEFKQAIETVHRHLDRLSSNQAAATPAKI